VRQGYSNTLSAVSQARGLEAAARSNEVALRANRRGYEVGMRINSEVLDAQTRLFEARRDLSRARYDAWINFSKLKALAAQLSEPDLVELEGLLVAVTPETIQRGTATPEAVK
jgi:outer membrane protein